MFKMVIYFQRLFEVYRDWERRMQVQRVMTFAPPGQVAPVTTVILDFKHVGSSGCLTVSDMGFLGLTVSDMGVPQFV